MTTVMEVGSALRTQRKEGWPGDQKVGFETPAKEHCQCILLIINATNTFGTKCLFQVCVSHHLRKEKQVKQVTITDGGTMTGS